MANQILGSGIAGGTHFSACRYFEGLRISKVYLIGIFHTILVWLARSEIPDGAIFAAFFSIRFVQGPSEALAATLRLDHNFRTFFSIGPRAFHGPEAFHGWQTARFLIETVFNMVLRFPLFFDPRHFGGKSQVETADGPLASVFWIKAGRWSLGGHNPIISHFRRAGGVVL